MPHLEGSIVPEATFMRDNYYLAVARYRLAARYARNKTVLEAGSGAGYGAQMLANVARKVYAIDLSAYSVSEGQKKYPKENLKFAIGDIKQLKFADNTFDLISAFEIIEHLKEYRQAIKEFKRVLKPGGLLILSTPNKKIYSPGTKKPFYPYHTKEFTLSELKLLLINFQIKAVWGEFIRGKPSMNYHFWNPKRWGRIIFANLPFVVKIIIMRIYLFSFNLAFKITLYHPPKISLEDVYFSKNVQNTREFVILAQKI